MSTLTELVPLVVDSARNLGIHVKLSSLRDAISFSLLGLPYSQAVFTERSGKPLHVELPPPLLGETCDRYQLDPIRFAAAFDGLRDYLRVEYQGCFTTDGEEVVQAIVHTFGRNPLLISERLAAKSVIRGAKSLLRSASFRSRLSSWLGGIHPSATDAFIDRISAELDASIARQLADMAAVRPKVALTMVEGRKPTEPIARVLITHNGKSINVDEQLVRGNNWALDQSQSSQLHWKRSLSDAHPLSTIVVSKDGLTGPRAGLESAVRFIWRTASFESTSRAFNFTSSSRPIPDELLEAYESPCEGMSASERIEASQYIYYPDHFLAVRDDPAWVHATKSLGLAQHKIFEMRFLNIYEFMLGHANELGFEEVDCIEGIPAEVIGKDIAVHVESAIMALHRHGNHVYDVSARRLPLTECEVRLADLSRLPQTFYVHLGKEMGLLSPFEGRHIEGCFVERMLAPSVLSVVFVAPTRKTNGITGEELNIAELIGLDYVGSVCQLFEFACGNGSSEIAVATGLKADTNDQVDPRWLPHLPRAIDVLSQALRVIIDEKVPRGRRPAVCIDGEDFESRCLVHLYR